MYHLNQIPSEAQIRKYLRRIVFGKNVFCPVCRSKKITARQGRYRCPRCRVRFSLLSHTWLHRMKLSLSKFWLLLWCWTQAVPVKQTAALAHASEEAVYHWFGLFRSHLPENPAILERIVQMDEAYGKGWALLMAKQPKTRKLAWAVIPEKSVQRQHAFQFLQSHVKPRSKLWTDGALVYRGIERWWPVTHERDHHNKWEFGKTSEIEGMFGNFRTFVRRMYHHITPDKVPDYVREFSSRFSSPEMFDSPLSYLQKTLSLVPFD